MNGSQVKYLNYIQYMTKVFLYLQHFNISLKQLPLKDIVQMSENVDKCFELQYLEKAYGFNTPVSRY